MNAPAHPRPAALAMNTPPPVHPAAPASAISAQQHLEQNRAQIAAWLEQDQQGRAQLSPLNRAVRAALPLLGGTGGVGGGVGSGVALLGTLVQAWLRSGGPSTLASASADPLALGLALVRRHPKTTLLAAGVVALAAYTWGRSPATAIARPAPVPPQQPLP